MARVSRAEAKEQTRATLLRSAGRLFAAQGYNATTVEAIVEKAGFTRGAFYAHFSDKGDLFATLLVERRRAAMDRIRERLETAPDSEKIGVIQTWYDSLDTDNPWGLAYAEFWPQAIRDPALRARLTDIHTLTRAAIQQMLDDYCAVAGVTLPIATSEMASMILAIAEGVATQRSFDAGLAPDAFMRTVTYLWFGVLGGDADAAFSR